jgi:shikimate kinase
MSVKADKIYLVGFMAAGKTTLAQALAKRLGWQAVDIDQVIENRERLSVSEIFAQRGEPYFRAVERAVLIDQLSPRHVVVATGGGTFVDPQNRAAINRDGVSVWLDVPLERVVDRMPTGARRPLAADRAGLERLYQLRQPAYAHAHLRLDAGRAGVEALVEQLVDWLEA